MGSSVLLVFIIPIMLVEWVCSLLGIDFDALWNTLTSAETTDAVLGAIAGVYNTFEPILKPIIEMFS